VKRFAPFVLLLVCLLLLPAPAALAAGTTTGIVRAHCNLDVYSWTPTQTGYLRITMGWTDPAGNPVGGFPEAEVDLCVQACDGLEYYAEMDVPELLAGSNPSVANVTVLSYQAGNPMFFSVSPTVADTRYHLTVDFRRTPISSYTRVIDATGYAHATSGDVELPTTATLWHSVIHYWPGSAGDLYANWNDSVFLRDGSDWLVNDSSLQWTPPVATDVSASGFTGHRVTVAPSIWNGAARPNVWGDPGYDTWPMPGSLSVSAAPAWYTWAYTDSAATTSAPAYSFGARIDPQASGQSLFFAKEPGATVSYTFIGDTLSWLYAAGPAGGTATLSVEPPAGSEAPTMMYTVDQYAAAMTYGRRLDLTGLGAGAHTVVVESDAGLYHDAFIAPTDAADLTPLAEDFSDGSTRYAWATAAAGNASGESYSYSAAADSATAFSFTGATVTWRFARRPDCGKAKVWIDGVLKGTVDQYGNRHKHHGRPIPTSITYTGLANKLHTILIVNTGEKSSASYGTVVTSDAFVVGGVVFED
jgi:hypothetical protein